MNWYQTIGISDKVLSTGEACEKQLAPRFATIDRTAEENQLKVLAAFRKARVSEECFFGTTGYGYNDKGRDTLEAVYAEVFGTEAALVRPQIACGTHALAVALAGNTRPGDCILSPVGRPYDTLEEVIGIRPSRGSLAEYGIGYDEVELLSDGRFDYEGIRRKLDEKVHLVTIQLISFIKGIRPEVICMVDNCYGEFVELVEPTQVGADLAVGSLIKNPGGGLAPIGGYIVGRKEFVDNAAIRLTSPGLGKEVGASLEVLRSLYQGFFLAPTVTASALKGAIFAAALFESLGFAVRPGGGEERYDIIQSIEFGSEEGLVAFCEGIQAAAPVDSFVSPLPWDMPGYEDPVIMAAGAFISGSSIELSADGPLRPPYAAYFQGGLTYAHAKCGILMGLQKLYDKGVLI